MTNFTQLLKKVMLLSDLNQAQTAINNERARRTAINGSTIPAWSFLPVSRYDYASGNLITNGNGETVSPAPAIFGKTGAAVNSTFTQSSTHVHLGSNAFNLAYTSGLTQFYWDFASPESFTNLGGLVPNTTYTLTAWVYVPSSIISLSNVTLAIYYSTDGVSWTNFAQSNSPTAYNDYQRLTLIFTLPPSTTGTILKLLVNEVGATKQLWVDDIYLRSNTPAVVADLRNSINNMINYSWTQSAVEYGYETALGQSEILWKINRLEENAETCNSSCIGFCQGCSTQCGTACATGCGAACATGCGGSCAIGCGTACASGCGAACQITCGGTCNESCSSCTGSCATGCSGTCFHGATGAGLYTSCNCGTSCSSTCGSSCSGCYTTCTSSCGSACVGGCGTSCQSGCGTGCAGGCGTACTNGCGTACQSGCGTSCQAGCGTCALQCYNACTGTCGGLCVVTCGSNCTAIASYATSLSRFITSPYYSILPGTIVESLYDDQQVVGTTDVTASVVFGSYVVVGSSSGRIASFDTVHNYWKWYTGYSNGTSNGPFNVGTAVNNQAVIKLLVLGTKLIVVTQNYVASYDGTNWKNYDGTGTGTGPFDNNTATGGYGNSDAVVWTTKLIIIGLTTTFNGTNFLAHNRLSSFDGTNWKYYNGTGTGTGPFAIDVKSDNTIGNLWGVSGWSFSYNVKLTTYNTYLIVFGGSLITEGPGTPFTHSNAGCASYDGNWKYFDGTGTGTGPFFNSALANGGPLPHVNGTLTTIATIGACGSYNGQLIVTDFAYGNTRIASWDGSHWKNADGTGTGTGVFYTGTAILGASAHILKLLDYAPGATHFLVITSDIASALASWNGASWRNSDGTGTGTGPSNSGTAVNSQIIQTLSTLIYSGKNYLVLGASGGNIASYDGTTWLNYNTVPTIITTGTYFTNNPPAEYFGVTGYYTSI
jgi:hypothetical protein